jgi:hypothetical protein
LSNILNLLFRHPNALSIVTLREECLKLKSSLGFCGLLVPYSLRWYLVPLYGGRNPGLTAYSTSTRKNLPRHKERGQQLEV